MTAALPRGITAERDLRLATDASPGSPAPTLAGALRHLEMGFAVLPVWGTDDSGACRCPAERRGEDHKPGKHPVSAHGFHDAVRDQRAVAARLRDPGCNYGIVWPEAEQRIVFVMDVDGDGFRERMRRLVDAHGPLPETKMTRTPNGLHVFFEWPPEAGAHPTGSLFGFVTRWPWKGYVLGPGSRIGGLTYRDNGKPIATLPVAWARAALAERRERPRGGMTDDGRVPVGGRHEYLRDRARALRGQGLDGDALLSAVMALNNAHCDPPKSVDEVRTAIGEVETRFSPDPILTVEVDEDDEWVRHFGNPVVIDDSVPMEAFHGPIGECALRAARSSEAPPLAVLATGLSLFGGMVGRGPHLVLGGTRTFAQTFALLVGATGAGKGLSFAWWEPVLDAIGSHEPRALLTNVNSGEGLVVAMLGLGKLPDGSVPAQVVIEEFAAVLRAKQREGQTLGQAIRLAYDGRPLTRAVAAGVQVVEKPALSMLAHVTPEELLAQASFADAKSGFLNRFLLVPVGKRHTGITGQDVDPGRIGERIDLSVRYARGYTGPVLITPAALELLDAVHRWQRGASTAPGLVGAMLERTDQHVRRLSLAYCLSRAEGPTPTIEVEDVRAAVAVASASEALVGSLWADRPANAVQATILDRVREAGEAGITPTALLHTARGAYRDKRRELVARMLDDGLLVKQKAEGTKGYRIWCGDLDRPPSLWAIAVPATRSVDGPADAEQRGHLPSKGDTAKHGRGH